MTVEELYFLHARINQKLFNGQLEAVVINVYDDPDEVEACLETERDPFIIFVSSDLLAEDPLYTATVLLHEMIHQYDRQQDIEDTDPDTGEHNKEFKTNAEKYGMKQGGYALTDETKALIKTELELYDTFKQMKR